MAFRSLLQGVLTSCEQHASEPALVLGPRTYCYEELIQRSAAVATALREHVSAGSRVAILTEKSLASYAGVLGVWMAEASYVPLSPKAPTARLARILDIADCDAIICDEACYASCRALLEYIEASSSGNVSLPVLSFDGEVGAPLTAGRAHRAVTIPKSADPWDPNLRADRDAYILFTSGSTGEPKGIQLTQGNAAAYLENALTFYEAEPGDRFSQTPELGFDPSVHDMFVCWWNGACLFPVPESEVFAPASFIREHQLTHWYSVPRVIETSKKLRLLKPGSLQSLRYSMFVGEALLEDLVTTWAEAAPNSTVENIYGPTESACITRYVWDRQSGPSKVRNGLVPIGSIFKDGSFRIVDEKDQDVPAGTMGELLVGGPQIAKGYLKRPELTDERFFSDPTTQTRWYRTGDLVIADPDECLMFVSRLDFQLKLRGHRVELQEIEDVLRREANGLPVVPVTVPWPPKHGRANKLLAFVWGDLDRDSFMERCRLQLPAYMLPDQVICVDRFPTDRNGKVDRRALVKQAVTGKQES